MSFRDILDKGGDMFMPKELAPFAGPLATMFAGPLGIPTAMVLGQLGSAKMNDGKLDPYTALGTYMSGSAYKNINPSGYGKFSGKNLGQGIMNAFDGNDGTGFKSAFQPANSTGISDASTSYKKAKASEKIKYDADIKAGTDATEAQKKYSDALDKVVDTRSPGQKAGDMFRSGSEMFFPGFQDIDPVTGVAGDFNLGKALVTVGSATTLTQIMPLAEEIKKQKALDEAEEGKIWKEWFDGYKRVSGRDYIDSRYPDPTLTEKYKQFMATGGRVGYNMGGDTGIIAAAPGMPQGMQLDGRDGMFISQGVEEKADDVPAMLSKNEFVLTADAMKGFDKMTGGNGNPRSAAQKMYEMMNQMEAIA